MESPRRFTDRERILRIVLRALAGRRPNSFEKSFMTRLYWAGFPTGHAFGVHLSQWVEDGFPSLEAQ